MPASARSSVFVKAHATGTPRGSAEAKASSRHLYHLGWLRKAQTSHLIGGAGALETVLTVLCLRKASCHHSKIANPDPPYSSLTAPNGESGLW